MPTVKVAMTPFPWSIDIDAPLSRARAMMAEHDIHHLPVTERGALVGVISGREVTLGAAIAEARDAQSEPLVREVCVLHSYAIEDTEPLDGVLATMARERHRLRVGHAARQAGGRFHAHRRVPADGRLAARVLPRIRRRRGRLAVRRRVPMGPARVRIEVRGPEAYDGGT